MQADVPSPRGVTAQKTSRRAAKVAGPSVVMACARIRTLRFKPCLAAKASEQTTAAAATGAVAPAPIGQRLRRIWPYFSQSPSAWAIAVGATVVASATEPLVPALLQPLLDKVFRKGGIDIWMVPVSLLLLYGADAGASPVPAPEATLRVPSLVT